MIKLTEYQQREFGVLGEELGIAERADGLQLHQGENRRQRRAATATFVGPKEAGGKALRRILLKQRQARALGPLKRKAKQ